MASLSHILIDARQPEDIPRLRHAATRIKAGSTLYVDEFGASAPLPDQVKQFALQSLADQISLLENNDCDKSLFFFELDTYLSTPGYLHFDHISISETKATKIQRDTDFNTCLSLVIEEFHSINGYLPSPTSTLERLEHKPPSDYQVVHSIDGVSINGSSPKSFKNIKRTISQLLTVQSDN